MRDQPERTCPVHGERLSVSLRLRLGCLQEPLMAAQAVRRGAWRIDCPIPASCEQFWQGEPLARCMQHMPVRPRPNKPIPPAHRGLAGLVFPGAVGTRSTLLHHYTSYFAFVALRARDSSPLARWACGGNWGLKSEFHKYDCGGRVVFVDGWICYCLWLSP